ncbi:MAG: SPASM domain-containing protein [Clostridia bacterium]|nr:SPASM domain-containing protein [Clostridia bacterium]
MKALSLLIKPVSGACEYSCEYCFYKDELTLRKEKNSGVMSSGTLENLVRRAFSCACPVSFMFQGGEPLLAGLGFFETFSELAHRYARGCVYTNSIQTNGGLLTKELAAYLKREGFLVGLSLDGQRNAHDMYRRDTRGEGTYERTRAAAKLLEEYEIPYNVLCVVSRANVNTAEETYAALKKHGYIQFIPCLDSFGDAERTYAPSPEEYGEFLINTFDMYERDLRAGEYVSVRIFDNYINMLSGRRPEACAMTGRCSVSFTVESDGSVYPCDFYCLDQWRLGSVNESGFAELEKSAAACEFVNSSVYMNTECRACSYFSLCRGGCRREREPFENGHPALNRYCASYKRLFSERGQSLRRLAEDVRGGAFSK